MKKIGYIAGVIALMAANTGMACSDEAQYQGTLIREHGGYHIQTPGEKLHISGAVSRSLLVDNVDNQVKVEGIVSASTIELTKMYVFNGKNYEVAFDWDQMKAKLYDN